MSTPLMAVPAALAKVEATRSTLATAEPPDATPVAKPQRDVQFARRSDAVTEVLGAPPPWLLRSGSSVLATVVVFALVLSFLIKYPDTIEGEATVVTRELPVSVIAKRTGALHEVFINEDERVETGQPLAVIQSTSDYHEVTRLSHWVQAYRQTLATTGAPPKEAFPEFSGLGELAEDYSALKKAHNALKLQIDSAPQQRALIQVNRQIDRQRELLAAVESKQLIVKQVRDLAGRQLERLKALESDGRVSTLELEQAQKVYLNEQLLVDNLDVEMASRALQIGDLQRQVSELEHTQDERMQRLRDDLHHALTRIRSRVTSWGEDYLLRAPATGRVTFFKLWAHKQTVAAGDELMVIVPPAHDLFAYTYVNSANSGKLARGQSVRIDLTNFPADEFGAVRATVDSISELSRDGRYLVKLDLPDGLATTFDASLPFSQEMSGRAVIVTQDLRLIQRLFFFLRKTYDQLG